MVSQAVRQLQMVDQVHLRALYMNTRTIVIPRN